MTNLDLLDIIYTIIDENDIITVDELCGFLAENSELIITVKNKFSSFGTAPELTIKE